MASTFRKGYSVTTTTRHMNAVFRISKSFSERVALKARFVITFTSYIMLSLVYFLNRPLATNSSVMLTSELKIPIAVP
ncbi:hypothetical protein D1872_266970 [compost metagenome]